MVRQFLKRFRGQREGGMTLIEVIVTMGLTVTVFAVVATGMTTATRLMGSNSLRLQEVSANKVAIEAMTKTVRTAVEPRLLGSTSDAAAFIQGDGKTMSFYAALSTLIEPTGSSMTRYGPVRVSYALSGTNLVETYQLPDAHVPSNHDYTYCTVGATGCQIRTRTLAKNIKNTTMFTYYGESQTALTVPLTADGLESVDSIDIVVTSQTSAKDESSTVVSRVSLVNSGNNPTASPTPTP